MNLQLAVSYSFDHCKHYTLNHFFTCQHLSLHPTPPPYTRLIAVMLSILTMFVLGVVLIELKIVLLPFVIAALVSVLLQPIVRYLRSKRLPTVLAMFLVLVTLSLFGFAFGLILTSTIRQFIDVLPRYETKFDTLVADSQHLLEQVALFFGMTTDEVEMPFNFSTITATARAGLNGVLSFLGNAFLILIFLLFMLIGAGQTEEKVRQAFPPHLASRIATAWNNIGIQVRQYLLTKTFVSFLTGGVTFLIVWLMGIDFPLIWGFLTFLLNFIPNIGSTIAVILPSLLSLLQFDTLLLPLVAFSLLVTTQMTIGNIVEPRMMGFSLNLSPLIVLLSLIFWGWLWGIWGMILAVPLTATIKIIFENIETLRPFAVLISGNTPSE